MRYCKTCEIDTEMNFCPQCKSFTEFKDPNKREPLSEKGDTFICMIWQGPENTRGIQIGHPNRDMFFQRRSSVILEFGDVVCSAKLTPGFWDHCPEIRTAETPDGVNYLKEWIRVNDLHPPGISQQLKGKVDEVVLTVLDPEKRFSVEVFKQVENDG